MPRTVPRAVCLLVLALLVAAGSACVAAPPDRTAQTSGSAAVNTVPTPPAAGPSPAATLRPTDTPSPASRAERTVTVRPSPTPLPTADVAACPLTPVAAPTSAATPGPNRLDRTTGLHMTGHVRKLKLEDYRLQITGRVEHPVSLTYDQLRCLPKVQVHTELACPGVFLDEATWAGAPLQAVLALAHPRDGATLLVLKSADGYSTEIAWDKAMAPGNFLAYEWEGQPLPILHGFPVRAVFPDMEGNAWAKWLTGIEVK